MRPPYTLPPQVATLKCAGRWFQQKLTQLQKHSAIQCRLLFALIIVFVTHAPPCRGGRTALNLAIDHEKPNVIAFLRSVGAPEAVGFNKVVVLVAVAVMVVVAAVTMQRQP